MLKIRKIKKYTGCVSNIKDVITNAISIPMNIAKVIQSIIPENPENTAPTIPDASAAFPPVALSCAGIVA
jgi:hypothetical protein